MEIQVKRMEFGLCTRCKINKAFFASLKLCDKCKKEWDKNIPSADEISYDDYEKRKELVELWLNGTNNLNEFNLLKRNDRSLK